MIYSLTDKLNFEDNPKIEIKGKNYEIKADAETVLELLDVLENKGEMGAAIKAVDLLFTEKDKKEILKKLKFDDFKTTIGTAMILAMGENPDEEDNAVGEA